MKSILLIQKNFLIFFYLKKIKIRKIKNEKKVNANILVQNLLLIYQ